MYSFRTSDAIAMTVVKQTITNMDGLTYKRHVGDFDHTGMDSHEIAAEVQKMIENHKELVAAYEFAAHG